jgi:hypothetical protein
VTGGARYRRVYTQEWYHPAFRRLNDGGRVVRFYVTAGPQTTSVGCFRLSTAVAVEDLGGSPQEFEERLETVCEAFGWAWDPLSRVIWIRDWFDSNPPASPNVVASWAKLLSNVPACAVKDEAIASIAASLKNLPASFREPWTELSKTSRRSEVRPEVQPEVQPETNQGTGIRDQRNREQDGASRRNAALKEHEEEKTEPEAKHLRVAREALRFTKPNDDVDRLVDVFGSTFRSECPGSDFKRADAVRAMAYALAERKAMR